MTAPVFPDGIRPGSRRWIVHPDPFIERVRVAVAWHNLGTKAKAKVTR